MDLNQFLGSKETTNTRAARMGADNFIEGLRSGRIRRDILPNSARAFPGDQEKRNFISYCDFIRSINGRHIIDMLEEINGIHDKL